MRATLLNKMWAPASYKNLDVGIRFAVKVLHAAGIETCQSCQGGKGHSYKEPTVEIIAGSDDALGFAALHALRQYGLPVAEVSLVWPVMGSLPFEKNWRVTFFKTMEERADDFPSFITAEIARP